MKEPTPTVAPPLITRDFVLLFAAHFLFGLSFWPYVLLPVFLQTLGFDLFKVGVVIGTASLAGIVARPWVGGALDRIGRRRCLMIGGLLFLAANLSYLGIHSSGGEIYFVRLLHGLGMGVLMATFFTLAADLSPATRRTEGIALFGISGHLSGSIGVLWGEQVIRLGGYAALFISGALLALLSLIMGLLIDEPVRGAQGERSQDRFLEIAFRPALRLPLVATVAFSFSMTSYMVFLKPYALTVGIGSMTHFFIAYTLTAVAVRLIGSRWPDRFGLKWVLYPAMVSMAIGILVLFFRPTLAGLAVGGMLAGVGHGFIFPILSSMILGREREENRGGVMTLFTMLYDFGLFIGAPLLGWVAQGGRYGAMFWVAASVLTGSLFAFVIFDSTGGHSR
ncbi:MAG: MFS transporter [Nitrospirae bacterium]|nr:MFS transporter [Candidatus Manganitrophaceae bacterium]